MNVIKRYWNKWTEQEERIFEKALKEFGKDFQAISDLLKDRSYRQVRIHYYNSKQQHKKQQYQDKEQYQLICYDTV
ncbi:SANT/Myb_domain [Hexamita inflata]|uniref:SANT/Myb domain n=1 Tax=Hexamita inflata TaxID=28002 RepID=A0AA86NGL9_9EUKA|nr:SANT/Myb domain [Hexamita inflata]